MKTIPTLETDRLILRPFTPEDAARVQLLAGDRAIADTTLNIPHPYENGMAEEWISGHADACAQEKSVTFAIESKAEGKVIGAMGLMGIVKGHRAELGYWIGKPYWNQGFSTEAAAAVLQYGFTELGLVRIHAHHFSRNPSSGRVMEKLGMQHEGTCRQHVQKWGKLEDIELYGILQEEWQGMIGLH